MVLLNTLITLLITFVYADTIGPIEQETPSEASQCSDLDATCTTRPQNTAEKEIDRNPTAEERCKDKNLFPSPEDRERCESVEGKERRARAEARERREKAEDPLYEQSKKKVEPCDSARVVMNCNGAYNLAMGNLTEENILKCEKTCSPSAYATKQKLMACGKEEQQRVSSNLAAIRKRCGVGGHTKTDEEKKRDEEFARDNADGNSRDPNTCPYSTEGACRGWEEARAHQLAGEDSEATTKCINGDMASCAYAPDAKARDKFYSLRNENIADKKTQDAWGNVTYSTDMGNGVQAHKTYSGLGGGNADMYYTDSKGNRYSSYQDAYVANNVPIPEPAPRAPVVAGGSGARGAGTTTVSSGAGAGGQTAKVDTADSRGGSGTRQGSGTQQGETQTARAQDQKQQQQQPSSGSNGGSSSGGSSSGGAASAANAYNPNGNFNLASGTSTGGSSTGGTPSFQGTGASTGSGINDTIGGDGGSGSGGNDFAGGQYNGANQRGRHFSSDGVQGNGGTPVSMASLGGSNSGGHVQAANLGRDNRSVAREKGDMNTSAFQNGFHKAPTPVAMMNKAEKAALMAKIKRLGKNVKKKTGCAETDLQCLANYFANAKKRSLMARKAFGLSQSRGIASVGELPQGVWRGYTDILSHMAKVHDKMPLDYEGGVEE